MPEEESKKPPKTVQEIGIHLGYMSRDLKDIKDTLKSSPTLREFDALKEEVSGKVSRREFAVAVTIVTTLLAILSFIFNNVGK